MAAQFLFLPVLNSIAGLGYSAVSGIMSITSSVFGGAFKDSVKKDKEVEQDPQSDETTPVTPPNLNIRHAKRINVKQTDSADKILIAAVSYLENIDENLKSALKYDMALDRKEAAAERETSVESMFPQKNAQPVKEKDNESSGMSKMIPILLGVGAASYALKDLISQIDPEKIYNNFKSVADSLSTIYNSFMGIDIDNTDSNETKPQDIKDGVRVEQNQPPSTPQPVGNSLGDRNNNPGNLRDTPFAQRQPGYVGRGEGGNFAKFDTRENGLRALAQLLRHNYLNNPDRNTPTSLVEAYAPGSENSTAIRKNYAGYIANSLGIGVNDPIPQNRVGDVAKAISEFETGNAETSSIPDVSNETNQASAERLDEEREMPTEQTYDSSFLIDALAKGVGSMANILKPTLRHIAGEGVSSQLTSASPNYDLYNELYQRNMESTIDTQSGLTKKDRNSPNIVNLPTQQRALQSVNNGSLDVIDPNYRVNENQVISNYLISFGYNR